MMTNQQKIEAVVREHHGRLIAALTGKYADLSLAEDVLQDAMVEALSKWSSEEWPPNPPAWLMTVASRKAIDRIRRQNLHQIKINQLELDAELDRSENRGSPLAGFNEMDIPDQRLQLIFACCHPALAEKNRTALILKVVCGLTTGQIAKAWLVSETTMAQRLVRTKQKVAKAGIPFSVPDTPLLAERLEAVLEVIYLIFNAGYQSSHSTDLIDIDLCEEAIYLGKIVMTLMPDQTEVVGLVALMLFHHARMDARTTEKGDLVTLSEQDRTLWNRDQIATADKILKGALMKGGLGPYQLQAAISAVHCHAATFEETDWRQILLLYHHLESFQADPVVQVNLAVALSFAEGPEQGICYLDNLPDVQKLSQYHPYYIARADMLRRAGDRQSAAAQLEVAISLTDNLVEEEHLKRQLNTLNAEMLG